MFGKRRDNMSQESKDLNQEKTSPAAASSAYRTAKREVELFPPIAERNETAGPAITAGGSRLGTQISMFQPITFDDALDIVEELRSRNATTISLDKLKKQDANRLVDFVAGASAALDGDFHKMTEQVFVFCPANMKIVTSTPPAPASTYKSGAGPSVTESFSLDNLFPDLNQEKLGGLSSLFGTNR